MCKYEAPMDINNLVNLVNIPKYVILGTKSYVKLLFFLA